MTFPAPPNIHSLAVLLLTVLALYLFSRDRIPFESSSLFILVSLTIGFELFPFTADGVPLRAQDFFVGFGHEALVAVCALMIAGSGLVQTGALEPVGRGLSRLWAVSPKISLLLTLFVGALLSAFINNTPIVVLLLPILISVSLRTRTITSGVLLPMGLATLLGGMATTIGTSTNLLVVAVAADMGVGPIQMFDFAFPATVAGAIGLLYLWLIAPRLLPQRKLIMTDTSPRVFTAQLMIPEDSYGDGKTLASVIKKTGGTMKVSRIRRGQEGIMVPLPDALLRPGDRLRVNDTPENLKEYEKVLGAVLYSGEVPVDAEHPLRASNEQVAEIVVYRGSPLAGSTLNETRFVDRYKLVTLALHRAGRSPVTLETSLGNVRLKTGDVLLVQGTQEQIAQLKKSSELLVLDGTTDLPHTSKAPQALAIMTGIVALAAFGILPIAISAAGGVLMMIGTGCLSWRNATRALSAQVILIIVASLALGKGMLHTGAANYLAHLFLAAMAWATPPQLLSGLILLMAALTNVVSNNAAAVIGTPIAVGIAQQAGLSAEPFVLAVLFGSNMSYATPMAYQTNLLVMNAGGYTFADFLRVGIPLTIIMWVAFSWLLPVLYLA